MFLYLPSTRSHNRTSPEVCLHLQSHLLGMEGSSAAAPGGVSEGGDVQPADAARPAGGGSVLGAYPPDLLRQAPKDLRWVWARPHPRRVRLRLQPASQPFCVSRMHVNTSPRVLAMAVAGRS